MLIASALLLQLVAVAADTVEPPPPVMRPLIAPIAAVRLDAVAPQDTVRRRRRAVEYSDAYTTRATIHRLASWAIVPLFVGQYYTGQKLVDEGETASGWVKPTHTTLALGVAGLFGINTVTGVWNLWEARSDPEGRVRRTIHGLLMLAADGGFVATGLLAGDAEHNDDRRNQHRAVAISSGVVALLSYAIMLPPFRGS